MMRFVNPEITHPPVIVPLPAMRPYRKAMAVGQLAGEMRAFAGTLISFAGGAEIMRTLKKLIAAGAVVASATAMAVGPALADPINGSGNPVTPKETDVVGVGSDTTQFLLDQLAFDYNKSHTPKLYSWDALNPKTGAAGENIKEKAGCALTPRPNGSSAGVSALILNQKTGDKKHFCVDYARSSRGRASTDPARGAGGILFVAMGKDAETYATNKVTNAPNNLTKAQLADIYTCTVTNWSQVGGQNAPIDAELPQVGSGTRAFWLVAIGVPTPGPCVKSTVEENEGVDPVFKNNPNAIIGYSIGKYIAQKFHSADCINSTCTGSPACHPTATQNKFGCDAHGNMVLHNINGTKPTVGTGTKTVINPKFTPRFIRIIFNVVRWANTADNIPRYLDKIFGSAKRGGWICSNSKAHTDLLNYGFGPTPFCGTGS
jgi:ABC-type phosphate transport system substrate-binding protein